VSGTGSLPIGEGRLNEVKSGTVAHSSREPCFACAWWTKKQHGTAQLMPADLPSLPHLDVAHGLACRLQCQAITS